MSHAYTESTEEIVKSYRRLHGNGEQTHVHILSCGERYIVLAGDVDPRDYEPVAGDVIAYSATIEEAQQRATAWMEQHPKGVVQSQSGGSGFAQKLWNLLDKLDQSAKNEAKQSAQQE